MAGPIAIVAGPIAIVVRQGRSLDLQTLSVVQFKDLRFTRENTYTCSFRRLARAVCWFPKFCHILMIKSLKRYCFSTTIHKMYKNLFVFHYSIIRKCKNLWVFSIAKNYKNQWFLMIRLIHIAKIYWFLTMRFIKSTKTCWFLMIRSIENLKHIRF